MGSRTTVGLDIGTSGVRAVELSAGRGDGPVTLARFGQVALPPSAVRDGEVLDAQAVAAALERLWSQTRFSSKRVAVGVANQKVVVRQVDLPWLPLPELRASLAFQVQDYIPMPVEQALLDVHPLEEHTTDGGTRMRRVLLVAASREMVTSTLAAVQQAGLDPVMVDLTPFAVLRALGDVDALGLGPGSGEAEALVDVGASVTNILVHQGGVPRFVRILLMGGADVTDALVERLGVPPEQAEAVKQAAGMSPTPSSGEGHPATRVIDSTGTAFVEEVRGSLDYYLAQPSAVRVRRIVLSGGGSRLGGLAARLSLATRLPVDTASPLARLKVGRTGLTDEQLTAVEPHVAVPLGLALGAAS